MDKQEPEIKDFGTCKVCGWGASEFERMTLSYKEYCKETNEFGKRLLRLLRVQCGRCDYAWSFDLKDEIVGDPVRFEEEHRRLLRPGGTP